MTLPISTSTTASVTSESSAGSTTPTSAGVSSVPSSMSSSAAELESRGCCSTISACITSVVNSIRDCLAKFPLIGWIFKREPAPIDPEVTTLPLNTIPDDKLIEKILCLFPITGGSTAAPARDKIDDGKTQFKLIKEPRAIMRAFNVVMNADNASDAIVKEFYDLLPVDQQNKLKEHIYQANGNNDGGHGFDYGDYMINNQIRVPVVRQAVINYIATLPALAVTATGTASTSST